jgi:signal transduction histidine kinase
VTALMAELWRRRPADGWLDVALAAVLLAVCEAEVITDTVGDHGHDHWPLAANILIVVGLTVPLAWRRRKPLASLVVVMSTVPLMIEALADVKTVNFPQLVLFIAPYSVAAYSARPRALLGLAYTGIVLVANNLLGTSPASSWVFVVAACGVPWIVGRILRARRETAAELRHTADMLTAEEGGRELLAIAEQRSRIARELQTLIAHSVSAMIVQTQTAQRLLDANLDEADAAMATIEDTGREALADMRRILGVLRRTDDEADLAPQPGVGQIPALVERLRSAQGPVVLHVEGAPGPMPASVDLGVYRILEEALGSAVEEAVDGAEAVAVVLRFGADDIELSVTSPGRTHLDWPTTAMRERAALCQGTAAVESSTGPGERLVVRLPRVFDEAVA